MRRTILVLAAAGGLGGCFDFGIAVGPGNWEGSYGGCLFCMDFGLRTADYSSGVLKGDTVRVYAWSTMGKDTAWHWSVSPELGLVVGDSLRTSLTRRSASALVKGLTAGEGTVRALAADTTLGATLNLRVVDSARIRNIILDLGHDMTLPVGRELRLTAGLSEGGYERVWWQPASATISDTTVVRRIRSESDPFYRDAIVVRGMAPGTATVTFAFLNLRQSVRIVVTP